jgi:hypothetical protein
MRQIGDIRCNPPRLVLQEKARFRDRHHRVKVGFHRSSAYDSPIEAADAESSSDAQGAASALHCCHSIRLDARACTLDVLHLFDPLKTMAIADIAVLSVLIATVVVSLWLGFSHREF